MKEYFKKESKQLMTLTEYIKLEESKVTHDLLTPSKIRKLYFMKETIGDVSLEKEMFDTLYDYMICYGGRYDVRTKKDTIIGIYDIIQKYPTLSPKAIDDIAYGYAKPLYDEFDLLKVLDTLIKSMGEEDRTIETYLCCVESCAKEFDKELKEKVASLLEKMPSGYSKRFTDYLSALVSREFYSVEDILEALPSKELVTKDEKHLCDIAVRTRSFFGGTPMTYQLLYMYLDGDKELSSCIKQPYYIATGDVKIDTLFTTDEYLDSVKETKIKKFKK